MKKINKEDLKIDFESLGVEVGDIVLVRASLGAVGRLEFGADTFIDALLDAVGSDGTIVSLAFTTGSFFIRPKKEDAFTLSKKSYAGALPNAMILRSDSKRSLHPMCSYVAIGKYAEDITKDHNATSPAYEPMRKIVELNGKCALVGCVGSSPGFTTTHLAETDLGYLKTLPVFPWLKSTYYVDQDGDLKIFRRKDPGLCSNSFYKFYAIYVKEEILRTGRIGKAYSIMAPAKDAYRIDLKTLYLDKKFNICEQSDCRICNVERWDRIHRVPLYIGQKILKKLRASFIK